MRPYGRATIALVGLFLLAACSPTEESPCPTGQVQDEATQTCVPEHCGAESWGHINRDEETIHVAPWGDHDGDGSEDAPFRSIQDGADKASEEAAGLVAVAAGLYLENITLNGSHDAIQIEGRCVDLVVIDGSEEQEQGILISGAKVTLHNLTVTGALRGIQVQLPFSLLGSTRVTGRDLLLTRNYEAGLAIFDSQVTVELDDSTVRDTQSLGDAGSARGITVQGGSSLIARSLLLDGNQEVALGLYNSGTSLELENTTIRNTQPRDDGALGIGIGAYLGASLVARDLLLEHNHEVALVIHDAETSVELGDTTIRETQPRTDGSYGSGISIEGGARLVAHGLLLEQNHDIALLIRDPGTLVELVETTIRDTQPRQDGLYHGAVGMVVRDGAGVIATDLVLDNNQSTGLFIQDEDSQVELTTATIRNTQPTSTGTYGDGIEIQRGARLVASDLVLENNHHTGLFINDAGTSVELENTRITGTQPPQGRTGGSGLVAQWDATVTASNLQVDDNSGPGLYVRGGSVEIWDATLERNAFAAGILRGGHLALHGGTVSATTVHPNEGGGVGLFAWDRNGPGELQIDGVQFSDLLGPALYLRGQGHYVLRNSEVSRAGTWPSMPGGILAVEGVEAGHEAQGTDEATGLFVQGVTFEELFSDAILLDGSSATLAPGPTTGAPNSFSNLDGVALHWQRCGDSEAPQVLDGSTETPSCSPNEQLLGPLLEYTVRTNETSVLQ
ncbi:MAG TPA: hypothetical protein DIU15_14115 [Deltaproteobacteria bacterium]|nr:hypothetical protein [Deltaproteobacteria bacterium]HCP47174.1 hypothetical protein [Deltaproteobacteria bacterium]